MAIFNILLPLLVVVLVFGGMIYLAISRTMQMKELTDQGVDTKGIVTEKKSLPRARSSNRYNKIAYTYQDREGKSYAGATELDFSEFDQLQIGGPIEVVYSAKHPGMSAPRSYVDSARRTLNKQA
jgi:hypothetical protein